MAGCESETSSGDPGLHGGGNGFFDSGTPDSPTLDGGETVIDGSASDTGTTETTTPEGRPPVAGRRLLNLGASPLDICVRKANSGDEFPPLPLFAAQGGLPSMSASLWAGGKIFESQIEWKLVAGGEPCSSAAIGQNTTSAGLGPVYTTQYYIAGQGGFFETATVDPAKDVLVFRRVGSFDTGESKFVPDDTLLPAVPIVQDVPNNLPLNVPGKIVSVYVTPSSPPPRPYLPKAGGYATVYTASDRLFLCDELAKVGMLADCRDSARAP